MKWRRLDGEEINLFKTIEKDIKLYNEAEIKFYVGTDSQRKKKHITYITSIILYRETIGGCVYYTKERDKIIEMTSRLWNETYKAVTVAQELNDFLEQFDLRVNEVHADLNPNPKHKSNSVVQSCLGFICGMGFIGKIKPDAWASSKISDRKTKN